MARILILAVLISLLGVVQSARAAEIYADDSCNDTTTNEVECNARIARRYEAQIEKDFKFLSKLAARKNPKSSTYFKLGQIAFRNFVQSNCESERHDAFGGSLEDVLEWKCRRDVFLERRRLFVAIAERHPQGPFAEVIQGRPVCSAFGHFSKPTSVAASTALETESLRRYLDQIAARAAVGGAHRPSIAKMFRSVHAEAEKQSAFDANFTCLGIFEGFCPSYTTTRPEFETTLQDQWLSRCQTNIRSAFYKRTTNRLRTLRSQ